MRQRQRVDDMKQSEVRTHINGQWRKAGERSAARACVGHNRMRPLMFLHLCPGDLSLYLSSTFALSLTPRMPASCDDPPAPPANLCPGVVIEKAHAMLSTRLQTGRHTLRSGGQIHGHPSTHSPANSMGTLRSSPSRVRPGNGRAPRYSTHLDRSDATSSSNLVISFRGRSHTIHSPSLTCFQDDVLAGVSCLVLSR